MTKQDIWGRIKGDWDVLILLTIAVPLTLLDLLPQSIPISVQLSAEDYLKLILLAIVAVASSLLRADSKALHVGSVRLQQKMSDLLILSRGRISAVRPDQHPSIWEGFVGNYFAVNAPWAVEDRSKVGIDAMVKKHVERYQNPEFNRATYVFFSSGEECRYFPKAMDRFTDFARKVFEISPEAADKIFVVVADLPAPAFTIFLGEKKAESDSDHHERFISYGILYLNEKPMMSQVGVPKWALVTVNEGFNSSLEDYVKDLVNDHEPVCLSTFLQSRAEQTKGELSVELSG